MNLLVAAGKVLKDDGDEAFMGDEALACEIAPMAPCTERLEEGNVRDAFRAAKYLREKLENFLERASEEPADDCLSPLVKHCLVED